MLEKVKLPLNFIEKVRVRVASAELILNEGKCIKVQVEIQGTTFTVEVHVLVLAGCDMVLGINGSKSWGLLYEIFLG